MEIQKKKETQWVIKKKDGNGSFKLKYYDDAGIITEIGIGLAEPDKEVFFEMTPLEFKNFVMVLKSFVNLLYSEGLELMNVDVLNDFQNNNNVENHVHYDENIDNVTEKEIENLRQIETGVISEEKLNSENSLNQKDNSFEELEHDDKQLNFQDEIIDSSVKETGTTEPENSEETDIDILKDEELIPVEDTNHYDTTNIFKEIDEIIPTMEKGENPDKEDIVDKENTITEKMQDDEPLEESKKKKNLDPKDWDPW
jgi:hypothetical protein